RSLNAKKPIYAGRTIGTTGGGSEKSHEISYLSPLCDLPAGLFLAVEITMNSTRKY
ncbi:hypothetical protein MTO96_041743, partial [Rhipicephalus appendiculatus]